MQSNVPLCFKIILKIRITFMLEVFANVKITETCCITFLINYLVDRTQAPQPNTAHDRTRTKDVKT